MKVSFNLKDGDEKLKSLAEAEEHIKKAKQLIMWNLSGEIEVEIKTKELPEESDSNKTTSKDSFLTSNEVENTAQLVAKKMVESMNQSDNQE